VEGVECVFMSKGSLIIESASSESPTTGEFILDQAVEEIEEQDRQIYLEIVSTELSSEQAEQVVTPPRSYPKQRSMLAVHWHPEWVPFDLISQRIDALFPKRQEELIIPTQHNQLLTWEGYSGAEIDCYASGFQRKVQLLLHFEAEKVKDAHVLKSMLRHTFKYRTSQLHNFMQAILDPVGQEDLEQAVQETGANQKLVEFVRHYTTKLRKLIDLEEANTPDFMIKNKLLTEFLQAQSLRFADINSARVLLLLKAVKKIVKRKFSLEYFFRASEVIEEVRSLGGGILIPHPEQFWPILLADYDVDGYEVWNPQSSEYTDFLIKALTSQNKKLSRNSKRLLIFMGDDTHMSSKIKDPSIVERAKREREIGLQPAWDELAIRKTLSLADASRNKVIQEYKERLA
jgi:hypothetical protein